MKRAIGWLFAVACLVMAVVAPRASALAERGARVSSVAPAAARDTGKALVRQSTPLTVAAPVAEPALPPVAHRDLLRLERSEHAAFDGMLPLTSDVSVRVVRWQRHIPRMDSGEPPRSDAFAS